MAYNIAERLYSRCAPASPQLTGNSNEKGIQCLACANRCYIKEGKTGICKMRINRNGVLLSPRNYVTGLQIDPIEKKPFFHVLPGNKTVSYGMAGCNFHCDFCQNWVSSQTLKNDQSDISIQEISAEQLVHYAEKMNIPAIVSTYNEPLITADWSYEIFSLAQKKGILCGFVSNGYATPEVIRFLRPVTNFFKVDLKTFSAKNYRKLGGQLDTVLNTIAQLHEEGYWLEVVTLIVPGFSDDPAQLRGIANFLSEISPDIPWHVTAFHPAYQYTHVSRTSSEQLIMAYNIGKEEGLHFVYTGNIPTSLKGENTYCPSCGAFLIQRDRFFLVQNHMKDDLCPQCNRKIPGIWSSIFLSGRI